MTNSCNFHSNSLLLLLPFFCPTTQRTGQWICKHFLRRPKLLFFAKNCNLATYALYVGVASVVRVLLGVKLCNWWMTHFTTSLKLGQFYVCTRFCVNESFFCYWLLIFKNFVPFSTDYFNFLVKYQKITIPQ